MIDGSFVLDAIGNFIGLLVSGVGMIGTAIESTIGFVSGLVATFFRTILG